MRPARASRTAQFIALFRALESGGPAKSFSSMIGFRSAS